MSEALLFSLLIAGLQSQVCADLCSVLIDFGKLEAVPKYFTQRLLLMVSVRWHSLEFYG